MTITATDILTFRKRHGFTQRALATFLGISFRTVQNYERGFTIPKTKMRLLAVMFQEYEQTTPPKNPAEETENQEQTYMKAMLKGMGSYLHLEKLIDPETVRLLDELPKEHLVAYLIYKENEFKEVGMYNFFIRDKIREGLVDELIKRFKN